MESRSRPSWQVVGRIVVAALVLAPLLAMQVTGEVVWTLGDFVFAALMLGGTWILLETVIRSRAGRRRKAVLAGLIVLALLVIWAEGAVGIF
jgi:hypothetical protein